MERLLSLPVRKVIINSFLSLSALGSMGFRALTQPETPKEGFRFCRYTESPYDEGLQEFSQIIDVGFKLNEQTGQYEAYNLGEPGSKGYVYPDDDGQIEPGNRVSGYYTVCQVQMSEPGVELFFYHLIKLQNGK